MGVRAVVSVSDESGLHRRFWAAWASKQYQIPHLAMLVRAADDENLPLTVDGYTNYAAAHPGTLPAHDITDEGWYADPNEVGDLDYRYELHLRDTDHTFRYVVYTRRRNSDESGWQQTDDLATRAQLFDGAAQMCRTLAANTERYANRNNGVLPVGWPTPQDWHDQAHIFTGWLSDTEPQLLHRAIQPADPGSSPVPQWFAVRTSREQTRLISAQLRRQYPGHRSGPLSAPTGS